MGTTNPTLRIQDTVRIMQTSEHERTGHANKRGVIVSFVNRTDESGAYQSCNIKCGNEVIRGISSRSLVRT